jgi:hypothetical protein
LCNDSGRDNSYPLQHWEGDEEDPGMIHLAILPIGKADVVAWQDRNKKHVVGRHVDLTFEHLTDVRNTDSTGLSLYEKASACLAVSETMEVLTYRVDPKDPSARVVTVLERGSQAWTRPIKVMVRRANPKGEGDTAPFMMDIPVGQVAIMTPSLIRRWQTNGMWSSALNVCVEGACKRWVSANSLGLVGVVRARSLRGLSCLCDLLYDELVFPDPTKDENSHTEARSTGLQALQLRAKVSLRLARRQ